MDFIILSYIFSYCVLSGAVKFEITTNGENFTLDEGETALELGVKGVKDQLSTGCTGNCLVNNMNVTSTNCTPKPDNNQQAYYITAILASFKVTDDYEGDWECTFASPNIEIKRKFYVKVNGTVPVKFNWTWVGVASGVVLVVLIIIGQTVCILHFKAKARKAQIDKNLTRKTSSNDELTGRYESPPKRSVLAPTKEVRESNIYEALDTVNVLPPVPPPIETLPRTPKPAHMSRSASQRTLTLKSDDHARTTPRQPKKQKDTVARSSSLERYKKREPMPLPVANQIYEVMQQDDTSEPSSSSRFNLALERSLANNGFRSPEQKTFKLPAPSSGQRSVAFNTRPGFAGSNQRIPSPSPQWTPNLDSRNPNCSPNLRVARCPVRMADGPHEPNSGIRGPMGQCQSKSQSGWQGPRAPMGAMPVLPSTILPANLRPVGNKMPNSPYDHSITPAQTPNNPATKFRPPPPIKPKTTMAMPVDNDYQEYSEQRNPTHYSPYDNRMTPAQSFNNLASKSRPPPASKLRPTMATGNVNEGYSEHKIHHNGTSPYDNRMAPAQSFSNLASISRPQIHQIATSPQHNNNRMAPAQSFSNLGSMYRPPSDNMPMPEDYYGSDDDEWTYEPLPQYKINKFGQPTKHF